MRLATPGDIERILTIYGPVVHGTATSFELELPSGREMEERLGATVAVAPWLVCESRGKVAGYAYAQRHRSRAAYAWSVETSVFVHPEYHRQGIGRDLLALLLEVLTLQGFWRCFAGITLPNKASVALHENAGFLPLGIFRNVGYKLGCWHDVGWWQTDLQSDSTEPRSPIFLAELVSESIDLYGTSISELKYRLRHARAR